MVHLVRSAVKMTKHDVSNQKSLQESLLMFTNKQRIYRIISAMVINK